MDAKKVKGEKPFIFYALAVCGLCCVAISEFTFGKIYKNFFDEYSKFVQNNKVHKIQKKLLTSPTICVIMWMQVRRAATRVKGSAHES